MAKSITQYNILVSCPGDVDSCVEIIERVIEKFNREFSEYLAIRLNPKHWSDSSYNQSGGKAQDLLNKQFIHDCDAAIAVFWTRFGTPTDRYGSGTQEEIEDMLASGKQVFLYFCKKEISPEMLLDENVRSQYQKVKDYQKEYEAGKGIHESFSSDKEFEEKLFAHISQHFLTLEKTESEKNKKAPKLQVKGIIDEKLNDMFRIEDMRFPVKGINDRKDEIVELYHLIASYKLKPTVSTPKNPWEFAPGCYQKKVEFSAEKQHLLRKVAEKYKIDLPQDFFDLGSLCKNTIRSITLINGGESLVGEDDEIEKYNRLCLLYHKIEKLSQWMPFERAFQRMKCIRLAIENNGTDYDEDIDVVLRFKADTLIRPAELPKFDADTCKYIVRNDLMFVLFGIPATAYYGDSDSSPKTPSSVSYNGERELPFDPFETHNYREDYDEELKAAFEYDLFQEGTDTVLKLHVDYLKHNTAVAFPTVLFVSENLSEIEYVIRSKRIAEATEGVIQKQ